MLDVVALEADTGFAEETMFKITCRIDPIAHWIRVLKGKKFNTQLKAAIIISD